MNDLSALSSLMCKSVDELAVNINQISEQIESASEHATTTLLNDGKILICSNSFAAPFAQVLTTSLMHQQAFERPSLPAINVGADATTISAISNNGSQHNAFAKQLRAIGREGDCLIALSIDGNCSNIVQAIQTAHEKGIKVITINGFSQGKVKAVILPQDKEILLNAQSLTNAMELMLLSVNALCRKIESQLFGIPLE